MKNIPKDNFATFQDRIFDQLTDRAEDEAQGILLKEKIGRPSEENHFKLGGTDVGGSTWTNSYKERTSGKLR